MKGAEDLVCDLEEGKFPDHPVYIQLSSFFAVGISGRRKDKHNREGRRYT